MFTKQASQTNCDPWIVYLCGTLAGQAANEEHVGIWNSRLNTARDDRNMPGYVYPWGPLPVLWQGAEGRLVRASQNVGYRLQNLKGVPKSCYNV